MEEKPVTVVSSQPAAPADSQPPAPVEAETASDTIPGTAATAAPATVEQGPELSVAAMPPAAAPVLAEEVTSAPLAETSLAEPLPDPAAETVQAVATHVTAAPSPATPSAVAADHPIEGAIAPATPATAPRPAPQINDPVPTSGQENSSLPERPATVTAVSPAPSPVPIVETKPTPLVQQPPQGLDEAAPLTSSAMGAPLQPLTDSESPVSGQQTSVAEPTPSQPSQLPPVALSGTSWAAGQPEPVVPVKPAPQPSSFPPAPAAMTLPISHRDKTTTSLSTGKEVQVPVPVTVPAGQRPTLVHSGSGRRKKVALLAHEKAADLVCQQVRQASRRQAVVTGSAYYFDEHRDTNVLEVVLDVPREEEDRIAAASTLAVVQALATPDVSWSLLDAGKLLLKAEVDLPEPTQQLIVYLSMPVWEMVKVELEETGFSLTEFAIAAYNRFVDHPHLFFPKRKARGARGGNRRTNHDTKPKSMQLTASEIADFEDLEARTFARNRSEFFDRLCELEILAIRYEEQQAAAAEQNAEAPTNR
ncbi:hypothetical protein [Streptosporangium sandarakinum]|uniref:hypothetical protein n=1 Tax=Streptosporangium sandarakinum TaxID=1260955 RepID=UPI0036C112DA